MSKRRNNLDNTVSIVASVLHIHSAVESFDLGLYVSFKNINTALFADRYRAVSDLVLMLNLY